MKYMRIYLSKNKMRIKCELWLGRVMWAAVLITKCVLNVRKVRMSYEWYMLIRPIGSPVVVGQGIVMITLPPGGVRSIMVSICVSVCSIIKNPRV